VPHAAGVGHSYPAALEWVSVPGKARVDRSVHLPAGCSFPCEHPSPDFFAKIRSIYIFPFDPCFRISQKRLGSGLSKIPLVGEERRESFLRGPRRFQFDDNRVFPVRWLKVPHAEGVGHSCPAALERR